MSIIDNVLFVRLSLPGRKLLKIRLASKVDTADGPCRRATKAEFNRRNPVHQ